MHYRQLGKTGLAVSTVSLGMWAMGGDAYGPVDDRDSLIALDRARELGVNFFDTADIYGRGHSEEVLGRWLKTTKREDVFIATKAGLWPDEQRGSRWLQQRVYKVIAKGGKKLGFHRPVNYLRVDQIIGFCEASLRRLGTDYIDVYQDHFWWDENLEVFAEAFHRLREAGKIRFFGLSANDASYIRRFVDVCGCIDTLQIDYSLLNRQPEAEVLPFCQTQQIGVIVRGPLAMGKLTGKFNPETVFPAGDGRNDWIEGVQRIEFLRDLERVERLRPLAGRRTMAQLALAYVLRHPAVTTTIPGAKNQQQVCENVAAAEQPMTASDATLVDQISPLPEAVYT
jgi:myo-inositol catabolism protein IolS